MSTPPPREGSSSALREAMKKSRGGFDQGARIDRRGGCRRDRVGTTHVDVTRAVAEAMGHAQPEAVAVVSFDHAIGTVTPAVGEVDAEKAQGRAILILSLPQCRPLPPQ